MYHRREIIVSGDVAVEENTAHATESCSISREDLINHEINLVKAAKEYITVIGGEFNTLEASDLVNAITEKLNQAVQVYIYIYDPKPQREHIDKLISNGAKVFLTKKRQNAHYFVVDGKQFGYHHHKRLDDKLLLERDQVPENFLNGFENTLADAKHGVVRLPNTKRILNISVLITIVLVCLAIFALPLPLNIFVAIGCLAPLFLEMMIIKI